MPASSTKNRGVARRLRKPASNATLASAISPKRARRAGRKIQFRRLAGGTSRQFRGFFPRPASNALCASGKTSLIRAISWASAGSPSANTVTRERITKPFRGEPAASNCGFGRHCFSKSSRATRRSFPTRRVVDEDGPVLPIDARYHHVV